MKVKSKVNGAIWELSQVYLHALVVKAGADQTGV